MHLFALFSLTGAEALRLFLAVSAAFAGSFFNLWTHGVRGSILSACLLIAISGALAVNGEHSLIAASHPAIFLALAVGLCFGLTFPCCAPRPKIGAMQIAGSIVVIAHALLDGHVLREASTVWLVGLLIAHKFQDGMDGRLLSNNNPAIQRLARLTVVLATPVGFFYIPAEAVNPLVHNALFAAIIGLNLGSAFHLFRHAIHIRRHHCAVP